MSTSRTEVLGRRERRHRWRLAAAVLLAILALGLPAVRVDAMARTQPGPVPAAPAAGRALTVATPVGRGPAAAAVIALTTAPAGRDPLAAVPDDFPAVMGYMPVPARMADGTVRLAKPTGACSAPGGDAPFGFEQVCKVHDYGYDLLRYAHAGGQRLTAAARRQLDAMFDRDLHARCQATRRGLARLGCHLLAEGFTAVVSVNSWRQHHGSPAKESLPGWWLGLAIPVVAAPFLLHQVRRRRSTRLVGKDKQAVQRQGSLIRDLSSSAWGASSASKMDSACCQQVAAGCGWRRSCRARPKRHRASASLN
jgi:Prokaryotic phospholipase A2